MLILPLLALVVFRFATVQRAAGPTWSEALMDMGGMALVAAGLWIRVMARQWKAERSHNLLVTDGLYGYIRHPLYVGSFLLGLGLAMVVGDWLLTAAFLIFFALSHGPVIRAEERDLEISFGEAYSEYRASTPALVPNLLGERRRVIPFRLREAIIRECDALCLWLALPLLIQLAEWSIHRSGRPGGADGYAALLSLAIVALAVIWTRMKSEYSAMIRRERVSRGLAG